MDAPHASPACRLHHRHEEGRLLPVLVWRFAQPWRVLSSAAVGGGLGARGWILNAQVGPGYERTDLDAHVDDLAAELTLPRGEGVGMLTAADVRAAADVDDGGVVVRATVGIRLPVWAGTAPESATAVVPAPGTINVVVLVPVPMTDGALVNLATTVTEAKSQALVDRGVAGTGTATDAVAIACPVASSGRGAPEPFGGPSSRWGGRAARASYAAVLAGVAHSRAVMARTQGDPR